MGKKSIIKLLIGIIIGALVFLGMGFYFDSLSKPKHIIFLGIKDLNTAVVIPFTSNLERADYEPNILFKKDETGLSKDSVSVIHLLGAAINCSEPLFR